MYLKQHRKANLQLEGRKLIGNFELSLTNQGDREVMMEFMSEMRTIILGAIIISGLNLSNSIFKNL